MGGAHKRGLKPQIFRENWGEIGAGNRAFSGLIGAFRGPIGPFRGRSGPIPPHLTATGEEQKLPRKDTSGPRDSCSRPGAS